MVSHHNTLANAQPWNTKRLQLREWRAGDAEVTDAYDHESAQYNPWGVPHPGQFPQWLDLMTSQATAGKRISWCVLHDGEPVGCVNLQQLNTPAFQQTAFVGFWARPQFRRRGYIREVLAALVEPQPDIQNHGNHILRALHKKQLMARVHPDNTASQQLLHSVGFSELPAILPSSGDLILARQLRT